MPPKGRGEMTSDKMEEGMRMYQMKNKHSNDEERTMKRNVHFQLWMIAACITFMLAGCAPTQVTVLQQTATQVPKPDEIRLYNFAASPDEVSLDRGISASIENYINKTPRTAEERPSATRWPQPSRRNWRNSSWHLVST